MKILWLASWYPNKLSPLDGDFIQRHARAVSMYTPLTVIYVAQYGEQVEVDEDRTEINSTGNLKEIIIQFRFKRIGIEILDKFRYNWKYYSGYKKILKEHFRKNGPPDFLHVHVPMKAGVIARWVKGKWKIPFILSEQASTYMNTAPDSFYNRNMYYRLTVAKIFSDAFFVTNVSEAISSQLRSLFKLSTIHTIHNVVDTNIFYYQKHATAIFNFIHVSAMNHQKNVLGMLSAFHELMKKRSDWRLTLVGPAGKDVLHAVETLGLANFVSFSGQVTYNRVAELMHEADSLVLFSRHENFPCVIVEALNCGLPVIATRIAGIPEAINHSNGILVDAENQDDLMKALDKMLDNYNTYDCEKIAADAKEKYGYETIGAQFLNLYEQLARYYHK
ncbi:MAG: glycosyltransferase [Agriterribacter sp.]